jgi:hypothetical protein
VLTRVFVCWCRWAQDLFSFVFLSPFSPSRKRRLPFVVRYLNYLSFPLFLGGRPTQQRETLVVVAERMELFSLQEQKKKKKTIPGGGKGGAFYFYFISL